ncbi:MAG: hypothetical protein HGA37_04640 [Lentimicrobium sp.]|nr:hypothetical protein [Lentimicrobium sp.]
MRKKLAVTNRKHKLNGIKEVILPDGYPFYPVGDDIYNKFHEEADIDPEEISRKMDSIEIDTSGKSNLGKPMNIESGNILDVPGSEPDDKEQGDGSEYEENNYYSIGVANPGILMRIF